MFSKFCKYHPLILNLQYPYFWKTSFIGFPKCVISHFEPGIKQTHLVTFKITKHDKLLQMLCQDIKSRLDSNWGKILASVRNIQTEIFGAPKKLANLESNGKSQRGVLKYRPYIISLTCCQCVICYSCIIILWQSVAGSSRAKHCRSMTCLSHNVQIAWKCWLNVKYIFADAKGKNKIRSH